MIRLCYRNSSLMFKNFREKVGELLFGVIKGRFIGKGDIFFGFWRMKNVFSVYLVGRGRGGCVKVLRY